MPSHRSRHEPKILPWELQWQYNGARRSERRMRLQIYLTNLMRAKGLSMPKSLCIPRTNWGQSTRLSVRAKELAKEPAREIVEEPAEELAPPVRSVATPQRPGRAG